MSRSFASYTPKSQICINDHIWRWPVFFLPLDFIDRDMEGAVCTPTHSKSFIDAKLRSGDCLSLRKRSEIEAELLPVRPRLQQILLLLHCGQRQRPERELNNNYHRGAYVLSECEDTWDMLEGWLAEDGEKKNGTFVLVELSRSDWHPQPRLIRGVVDCCSSAHHH